MVSDRLKLRVGVVGLGKMGVMHACLLNTFSNVKVSALCDKSRLMRLIAKQAFPKAFITNDLVNFDGLSLDAIFVLTPIPSHYPIIRKILTKNLASNIFVEKTLTARYNQSVELCQVQHNRDGVNMVGYMKRFGVTFNKAKDLLEKQVLGKLESFDAYGYSADFSGVSQGSTISKARGGVLEDLGSHVVDLALWSLGDQNVTSAKVNSKICEDSEDDVSFAVSGLDGLQGKFEVSWLKDGYRMPEFGLTIFGTKGSMKVNDDEVRLSLDGNVSQRWYRQDLDDNVGFLLGGPEYYREDKEFLDMITSGQGARCDFNSALKVDYLLEQVRLKIA